MTSLPSQRFLTQQAVMNAAYAVWGNNWRVRLYFSSRNGEAIPPWFYKNVMRCFRELREAYK